MLSVFRVVHNQDGDAVCRETVNVILRRQA